MSKYYPGLHGEETVTLTSGARVHKGVFDAVTALRAAGHHFWIDGDGDVNVYPPIDGDAHWFLHSSAAAGEQILAEHECGDTTCH